MKIVPRLNKFSLGLQELLEVDGLVYGYPTLELPYVDWLKLAARIELETGDGLDYQGEPKPRGQWFIFRGLKIRSLG